MQNESQRTYVMRCGCRLEQKDLHQRPHTCCPEHKERLDHVLLKCECGATVTLDLGKIDRKYCPQCYETKSELDEPIYNPKKEINDALEGIWPSTEIPEKYL